MFIICLNPTQIMASCSLILSYYFSACKKSLYIKLVNTFHALFVAVSLFTGLYISLSDSELFCIFSSISGS